VRNWGFYSQSINISKEIYSFFDDILSQEIGYSATNIIDTFDFMTLSLEKLLTDRFQILSELKVIRKPYDLLLKYHETIGQGKKETDQFASSFDLKKISTKKLFFMILSHYDLRMADNYFVDITKLSKHLGIEQEKSKQILDNFSFSFGALYDHKKEFFFLDNPVWNRPVIKDGDKYFCALPQLFFSFVLSSLDEIIEKVDKEGLHKRRADYLEKKIEDIVKRRFPSAQTVSGLKWDLDGKQYETDLITFIDSHALIIEVKSQRISKPALRGAPDRIKRHLKEILVEPSIQSHRFEQKLEKLRLNNQHDKDLINKLPIDFSNIQKFIRVSVSLEDFASLQSNLSLFEETGWLPDEFIPCPTMNLADFEILFDFLEHPVQIIHYLQRRTELEGNIKFIGDELDFMGLYITTLLNVENMVTDDQSEIIITDMSEPLDKYYMSKDQGIMIEKPKPKISPLFKEIFHKLEKRATPRWTEIGVILNRFPPADQLKLAKYLNNLNKIVEKKWRQDGHKNTTIYNPPASSEYALAFVLYKDENANDRDKFIEHASNIGLEPEHVKYCIIIAKNIDKNDSPYHFIALAEPSSDQLNKENDDGKIADV
jgi:hypothetical protein